MAINRTKSNSALSQYRPFLILLAWSVVLPLEAADIDASALPPLTDRTLAANPYRDREDIIVPGRAIFNQNCARCHGVDAVASGTGAMPAPDLRRLGTYCRRLTDEKWRNRCRDDTDAYFLKSVLKGKTIVGIEHMPAWEGILSQEALWAVRTYLESRGGKPRS